MIELLLQALNLLNPMRKSEALEVLTYFQSACMSNVCVCVYVYVFVYVCSLKRCGVAYIACDYVCVTAFVYLLFK